MLFVDCCGVLWSVEEYLTNGVFPLLLPDENYTLNSNELSEEIAALQHRIAELSADLAEI